MRAFAVVDLGFGDAGKGLVTDYLVRQTGSTAVVRFNGGAQAGHNVVTADGRHHTFAQFGSGTFNPGVRTFLSRHVVVDPPALLVEERALRRVGVVDAFARLTVHADALVATPYHRALNCFREAQRGEGRHGSCGVGFGETVRAAIEDPHGALRAADLTDPARLEPKLRQVADRTLRELRALGGDAEARALQADGVAERIVEAFVEMGRLGAIADDRRWQAELRAAGTLIFEGAQGLLLCERHGFAPHTTWSRCDLHHVNEIVAGLTPPVAVTRLGVLRAFAVRHGPGPLPTETGELRVTEPHNLTNPWQGPVRYGWFDGVLGRYAIAALGGVDALAITHLDVIEAMAEPRACDAYRCGGRELRDLSQLPPARLAEVEPILEGFGTRSLAARLGSRVALEARGPTASDVKSLGAV